MRSLTSIILLSVVVGARMWSADYYIDFDHGDDALDGTAATTPWKHAPGSAAATAKAKEVVLAPGDTALFKGGVIYRDAIVITTSGEAGKPITYKGDGWGSDKAIIDGSAVVSTPWTPCTSAEQVRGNPNFQRIYCTNAPAGYQFSVGTYELHDFLYPAQDPTPTDQFNGDRTDQLRKLPFKDSAVAQTQSSIMDSRYLTQSDPNFYDGATMMVWHQPNVTRLYKITGFDPATHTITHEKIGGNGLYFDRETYYAILNHPAFLSGPGQYCHDQKSGKLYVWPRSGSTPSADAISISRAGAGITITGKVHHVCCEGFIVEKSMWGIQMPKGENNDVMIRNNVVRILKANDKYGIQVSGTDIQVINNTVTDCQRAVGIIGGGKNITIQGNYVERTSRQGIWFMGVNHGEIIGNTVNDINGTHSNGISVYNSCQDILIAGNKVLKTGSAMTYSGNDEKAPITEGFYVINNVIDGPVNCWEHNHRDVVMINNTFLGVVNMGAKLPGKQIFINNIVHKGGGGKLRNHTLFTALNWDQAPSNKWAFAEGDIDWSKKSRDDVFVDLAKGDFHLKVGSPAIGTGVNAMEHMPTALFPNYDFSKDIDGKPRAKDGAWDIGALAKGLTGASQVSP
ncbi:MAG: right-handed parallel beta-helix repeat-containing protein [Planctomycetota bacterium]